MGSKWRDIRRTTTADHFSTRTNDPRQMELPFPKTTIDRDDVLNVYSRVVGLYMKTPTAIRLNVTTLNQILVFCGKEALKVFPPVGAVTFYGMRLFEDADLADGEFVFGIEHENAFLPLEAE